jgi:hypothetical protein
VGRQAAEISFAIFSVTEIPPATAGFFSDAAVDFVVVGQVFDLIMRYVIRYV